MQRLQSQDGLEALKARIAVLEGGGKAARRTLPLDGGVLDGALPGGGLVRDGLHELHGPGATAFAAWLGGRLGGVVVWCAPDTGAEELYAPGLAQLGLAAEDLVAVRCTRAHEVLWAMEEALRSGAAMTVVGEPTRALDLTASRRLHLAALRGGATGLVVCGGDGERLAPSAVLGRWHVAPAAGGLLTARRWRLSLLRCRGGGRGSWMVEWDHEADRLRVVSAAGHGPAEPAPACRLAG